MINIILIPVLSGVIIAEKIVNTINAICQFFFHTDASITSRADKPVIKTGKRNISPQTRVNTILSEIN